MCQYEKIGCTEILGVTVPVKVIVPVVSVVRDAGRDLAWDNAFSRFERHLCKIRVDTDNRTNRTMSVRLRCPAETRLKEP